MAGKKEDKKPKAKPDEAAAGAEGGEGEAPAKKKLSGKQLVLFIALPAVLVLGGGGAAAFFLLGKKPDPAVAESGKDAKGKPEKGEKGDKKGEKKEAKKEGEKGKEGDAKGDAVAIKEGPNGEAFYTLPDVVVNIATTDGKPAYLRLKLSLQTADTETAEAIAPAMPVILDQYTAFLRELRMEDIAGSAGSTRLRLELLKRVNLAVAPAVVQAVLVEEMLVQ